MEFHKISNATKDINYYSLLQNMNCTHTFCALIQEVMLKYSFLGFYKRDISVFYKTIFAKIYTWDIYYLSFHWLNTPTALFRLIYRFIWKRVLWWSKHTSLYMRRIIFILRTKNILKICNVKKSVQRSRSCNSVYI